MPDKASTEAKRRDIEDAAKVGFPGSRKMPDKASTGAKCRPNRTRPAKEETTGVRVRHSHHSKLRIAKLK